MSDNFDPKTDPFTLISILSQIPDPRIDRSKKHPLINILIIALCAVIAGAECFTEIEDFALDREDLFREILDIPNGIPSHDTFARVFALMDPKEFEKVFRQWVLRINAITQGEVISIDGKTLRRAFDNGDRHSALHMISAWATDSSLVLGQIKSSGHSNEIESIPHLLDLLQIKGATVTLDAMGCQKKIAAKVLEKGANYVLSAKANHEYLHRGIQSVFEEAQAKGFRHVRHTDHVTQDKGHGRVEKRSCVAMSLEEARRHQILDLFNEWPGLRSIARITAERSRGKKHSQQTRYFIVHRHSAPH